MAVISLPSPAFFLALSEIIKERRLQLGLDQNEASRITGIGVKTVSANEHLKNTRTITLDNLLRYCHGYQLEGQEVLEEAGRRTPAIAERMAEEARRRESVRLAEERRALRPGKRVSLRCSTTSGALRSSLDPGGDYAVVAGRAAR
jgi:transcriptional regulator with XRE-family HTH domain